MGQSRAVKIWAPLLVSVSLLLTIPLSNAAHDGSFSRSLASFENCSCIVGQYATPLRLNLSDIYLSTPSPQTGPRTQWFCFQLLVNTTGTVCDVADAPAKSKACCSASFQKVEFIVASGCKGTTTMARLYNSSVEPGGPDFERQLARPTYLENDPAGKTAALKITKIDVSQAQAMKDGMKLCINVQLPPNEVCSAPIYFPGSTGNFTTIQYRLYDRDDINNTKCCPEGNTTYGPPPGKPDGPFPPPTQPPSSPSPPPAPPAPCRCMSYAPTDYPWRVELVNTSTKVAYGGSLDNVCVKLYVDKTLACNNTLGCCRQDLKRFELFNLDEACVGVHTPFTISTKPGATLTSFTWDRKSSNTLKFTKLDLTYAQGATGDGVSLCFVIRNSQSGCTTFSELCPGGFCYAALFSKLGNVCCPSMTI